MNRILTIILVLFFAVRLGHAHFRAPPKKETLCDRYLLYLASEGAERQMADYLQKQEVDAFLALPPPWSKATDDAVKNLLKTATAGTGTTLNRILWNGTAEEKAQIAEFTALLSSGIKKLPIHQGTVRRHVNLPPEQLKEYKKGKQLTEPVFVRCRFNETFRPAPAFL